ncbi:SRPBCC family protein [Aridibaculum aurantiacum]|uniref:SRPBCC family protein n=1 Tax=Aridibaculum aurantiacum TaxID=2810307 RepID=UPI001A9683AC|nr:SRPBCC family protein [Aridibaculum aurantiacum]
MKLLKRILAGLAVLIVLLLVVALFVKKEYTVQREVTINKPKQEVFSYIKYLRNQDKFSKWASMDPAMRKEYRGTDGTVGFVSGWESDKDDVGKGEQTIKRIEEGNAVDFDLHFIEPFEGRADARMTTQSLDENQTKVTWSFHSKMPYPMNVMILFMDMDTMIGEDLQVGLNNLKTRMEKNEL